MLATTGLSACGNSGSPLSKDVTLHMVAADYGDPKTGNSSTAYWNEISRSFTRLNPHITVDIQVVDWDHVDDKVSALVKAGQAPDIAQIGSYADYAAKGQLYSVDDLFPISMQADFLHPLVVAGSQNRVQYGIPWVSSSRMFFYNKTLFKQAHIKTAPRTWADIKADAVKLKAHGVKVPYGLPLGTEEAQAETLMWLLGGQGGYTDGSGNYAFDSTSNIQSLTWLKNNLVAPGLTGPKPPGKTNRRDTFADFLAGRAGMINGHPTLLAQAKAAHLDVGAVALPGLTGPSPDSLGVADWMMGFKQGGHKEADGAFLKYVYNAQNSLKFLDEYGLLPVTVSASEAMRHDPADKALIPFLDLLPDAAFYPADKTSWGLVSDQIKKVIGGAVTGDPGTVLTSLQGFAEQAEQAEQAARADK